MSSWAGPVAPAEPGPGEGGGEAEREASKPSGWNGPALPPPPSAGGGLRLDDLRHPHLGGRVWGYDREEVDALLALVVTTIERLQRRRQRDAALIEGLTRKADAAQARADDIEHQLAALSSAADVAEEAAAQWQRRAREAEERAADAEEWAARAQREAEAAPDYDDGDGDGDDPHTLPLAQRAARELLREARASAASIVAEAEERARAIEPDDTEGPETDLAVEMRW